MLVHGGTTEQITQSTEGRRHTEAMRPCMRSRGINPKSQAGSLDAQLGAPPVAALCVVPGHQEHGLCQ